MRINKNFRPLWQVIINNGKRSHTISEDWLIHLQSAETLEVSAVGDVGCAYWLKQSQEVHLSDPDLRAFLKVDCIERRN